MESVLLGQPVGAELGPGASADLRCHAHQEGVGVAAESGDRIRHRHQTGIVHQLDLTLRIGRDDPERGQRARPHRGQRCNIVLQRSPEVPAVLHNSILTAPTDTGPVVLGL